MSPSQTFSLLCHPEAINPAVKVMEIVVCPTPAGGLSLCYRLRASADQLRIPALKPFGAADGLWEHTCFEAFIAVEGDPAYLEFNFSPSGQWATYRFSDYRRRDESTLVPQAPQMSVLTRQDCLGMDVVLDHAHLPPVPPGRALLVGLATVLEAADGGRTYWALKHPAVRPDFHHRDGFAIRLAVQGQQPKDPE